MNTFAEYILQQLYALIFNFSLKFWLIADIVYTQYKKMLFAIIQLVFFFSKTKYVYYKTNPILQAGF